MTSSSGVGMVDLSDRSARSRLRSLLGAVRPGAVAIASWIMVFVSAAAAQAPPAPPASCATSPALTHDMWDDRIQIAVMPDSAHDSVEFKWDAPEHGLDYWVTNSEINNSWVVCLPTVPGLASSYVAVDRWLRWPLTTVFDGPVLYAGLDHEASIETMTLRGLAPGIDYWVKYHYVRLVIDEEAGTIGGERAFTNWIPFRLEGESQPPAAVNVHGAGTWEPRRMAPNEITVYWSASAGGGVVESFQVRAKEAASGSWGEWQDVPGGSEPRWHTFGGLTPGAPYTFEVRAINSIGAGVATSVVGTPRPDSRILEAPCPLDDRLGEPSATHNDKVWMTRRHENPEATLSGTAMLFGWFVDGEPTEGSVEYKLCRPVFPGSKRYRVDTAMQNPADLSPWPAPSGYVVAIDGLALEDQYWIQAVHQPPPDEGGEVEVTTWIRAHEAYWRFEVARQLDERDPHPHRPPAFARRIGYDSFPGILETFGTVPLRAPAMPGTVRASERSSGSAVLRWEPSTAGGRVEEWQYRTARDSGGGWTRWRTMPGDADRLTHVVDGLTPGERYTFDVRGVNRKEAGWPGTDSIQLSAEPPSGCSEAAGSTAEGSAVCLGGGRFRFEATWESPQDGRQGAAQMRRLTGSTGVATFFNTDNVELVFKVLDGTEANGNHWVFYGGMTDLGYTLTVTDTQTGEVKSYRNEPGSTCGGGDTTAFGADSASSGTTGGFGSIGLFSARTPTPWARSVQAGLGCPGDALCLAGGRFEATVEYTNPATGLVASGRPMLGTDNTGYMTFFSPDNVELAIKVLDGRAFNDSYWVFATGLTDVDYTITVKDTFGGEVKTYSSQDAGQFCTIQDLDAFPQ